MPLLPDILLLPNRTVSQRGAALRLAETAAAFGLRGLLVHGRSLQHSGVLAALLANVPKRVGMQLWCHAGGEPTTSAVDALRMFLRDARPDWVAAVGGGSVLDLAKAATGLAQAKEPTAYYQTHPRELPPATIPLIAVPTTAGTGSEATVVAVLTDPERILKQSIRHPSYMPRLVILDPDLLRHCPPATRAAAGLDAFVQAFESYTSRFATPFTRVLSEVALVRISRSLLPFCVDNQEAAAAEMLDASYLAGIALSHARLGVVHGLAHPLGVRFRAAHGLVCACCLPACLAFNRETIQTTLRELHERHGLDVEEQVAAWLRTLALENPLTAQTPFDRDAVIREALASGSTAANPRPVDANDLSRLLDAILRPIAV